MRLIFSALAIFSVVAIFLASGVAFWSTSSSVEQAKQEAVKTLATGLSFNISSQMKLFEQTVNQMAKDEDVITALEIGDAALIEKTANKLQGFFPMALKIRLLPATVNTTDESQKPIMGFADLEMVKKTLTASDDLPPIIQGEGENRHLAITAPIKKGDQVIGVLLASLKIDFLAKILEKTPVTDGYIGIMQSSVLLGYSGDAALQAGSVQNVPIMYSTWQVSYLATNEFHLSDVTIVLCFVVLLMLSACAVQFLGYRYMSSLLKKDQDKVLEAVKNLMTGKGLGAYQLQLSEMQVIISTLVQFKRILDNKSNRESGHEPHLSSEDFEDMPPAESPPSLKKKVLTSDGEGKAKLKLKIRPNKPVEKPTPEHQASSTSSATIEMTAPQTKKPAQIQKTGTLYPNPANGSAQNSQGDSIFKAYDIRGIVDKDLTKEVVYDIGCALGSEAKLKDVETIVVARDGRLSSPELSAVLIKGIISTGRKVINIGMVPTPVLYFVATHTEGRTGVMLTGSHNPANYNGLKMMLMGESLANEKIQRLKERIDNEDYITETMGSVEQNSDYEEEYVGTICDDIKLDRKLKVVVDCGNGAAGRLAPQLLKAMGCELIELFCEVDGTFPNHHPDPSKPENMKDLIAAVAQHKADIGLAFDGDGDRLGVVDSAGKIIWPDRQMMLYAKQVLSQKPGAEIIYDVKCSRHLAVQIKKHGGRPVMWKTGHSLVKAKLKETGAALAGEMSGHIFFNDRWFGFDDALYTAARLLEILAAESCSSSELFAEFPDSVNTPELNVHLAEGEKFTFMEKLTAKADFPDAQIIDIDGLRVEFKDGWGLVRASNTTPVLVVRFEADTEDALVRIQQQFKKLMIEIKSDIQLPF